jgi:hypothetical protein
MQKAYNIAGIKKSRQGLNIGRNQFIVQQNPVSPPLSMLNAKNK